MLQRLGFISGAAATARRPSSTEALGKGQQSQLWEHWRARRLKTIDSVPLEAFKSQIQIFQFSRFRERAEILEQIGLSSLFARSFGDLFTFRICLMYSPRRQTCWAAAARQRNHKRSGFATATPIATVESSVGCRVERMSYKMEKHADLHVKRCLHLPLETNRYEVVIVVI